jgi:hypothetical protein
MGAAGKTRTSVGAAIALAAVIGIGLALYAGMGSVVANARPELVTDVGSQEQEELPDGLPAIMAAGFTDENFYMLYDNYDALAAAPAKVDITGQIVGAPWMESAEDQSNAMSFQMYQGTNILDYRYISVTYNLAGSPPVEGLDCMHVTGTTEGYRVFTDQHGPYTLPNVVDAHVERLDCVDYLYHAEKAIEVGKTYTYGGISVSLEKVEFAREHTRAYISVSNSNPEPVNFLKGARVAYQGHHHYLHLEGAPNVHMPEIDYTIMPGEVQHGVVLFKPLDYTHDSLFKFAAKNGFESYIFKFEVPSPFHHGESEGHAEEEGHAETDDHVAEEGHEEADSHPETDEHASEEEHAVEKEHSESEQAGEHEEDAGHEEPESSDH